jgi:bacterioferritin
MTSTAHTADVPTWSLPAPAYIEESAVAAGYSADRAAVLQMLNDALATGLVCVLHYRRYHFVARGLDSQRVARELLAHSYEELGHAGRVAERIVQVGGEHDPTTRRMLEGILAVEEKHANELADLLVAFPNNSSEMSPAATSP